MFITSFITSVDSGIKVINGVIRTVDFGRIRCGATLRGTGEISMIGVHCSERDLASLAGDFRRLGGYEALIASCISSFEPITYGYVYGEDIVRCSVDDYLEENPHLAMLRFNNPHAC